MLFMLEEDQGEGPRTKEMRGQAGMMGDKKISLGGSCWT